MSPAQVAARCGLSKKTVYRAIHSGALRAYRPASKLLIPEEAFAEWMEQALVRPNDGAAPRGRGQLRPVAPERGSAAELQAIEDEAA
jgi:excisionase family DNA binding protein